MKKAFILVGMSMTIFACSQKMSPATATSEPRSNATITVSSPEVVTPAVSPAATSKEDMVLQGKTIYTAKCGKCHGLKDPSHFTAQSWDPILKKMAPKAHLTDPETEQVSAYVMSNAKS